MKSSPTSHQREIVLPTASVAALLLSLVRVYRKAYKNSLLPDIITAEQAEQLIAAFWEEAVTAHLLWLPYPIEAVQTIDSVIPGFSDEANRNRAASIAEEIFAPIRDKCAEIIACYIPDSSWMMWTIEYCGHGNHILEEGTDFRIYEWERMVRENEISYPHIVLEDQSAVHDVMDELGFSKINPRDVQQDVAERILHQHRLRYG